MTRLGEPPSRPQRPENKKSHQRPPVSGQGNKKEVLLLAQHPASAICDYAWNGMLRSGRMTVSFSCVQYVMKATIDNIMCYLKKKGVFGAR